MATTPDGSRSFGRSKPFKRHLVRGSGGVQAEVADLRADVDSAFCDLEISGQLGIYRVDTVPPTVNDDDTQNFVRFSQWLDTATGMVYECTSNATGAAVWNEITNFGVVPGGLVASVFGRTGIVTSAVGDYVASQVTNNSTVAGAFVSDALDTLLGLVGSAPVDSVFGRLGAVVAAGSDYDASQVDNDSGVTGSFVSDALNTLNANKVPNSRVITAGAGLVGTGDLSADRTFDVVADPDGSIVVGANNLRVGILATDAQHGSRGGGSLHADATGLLSGFMSNTDKAKLNTVEMSATNTPLATVAPADVTKSSAAVGIGVTVARADHKHDVSTAAPAIGIGVGNFEGVANSLARSDHGHALRTTLGPTDLPLGDVADGQVLQRSGTSIVGVAAAVLTAAPPVNVTKVAAAVGVATDAARADHKHDITTASPAVGIGAGNQEGSASELARADHSHALRTTEGGGTDLLMGSIVDGQVLIRSGNNIVGAAPGVSALTFGGGNLTSTGTTPRYLEPWHDAGAAGTTEVFIQDWPFACTVDQLRLTWTGSPNAVNIDFVLRVNGVDTALAVTVSAQALAASNLASSVSIAAGDQVSFVARKAATLGGALGDLQASMRVRAA